MKTKWYESSPGNVSSTRIMSMIWLFVSLPMLYILIFAVKDIVTDPAIIFSWDKAILLITIFLLIICGWIAPKAIKSFTEENGILSKLLAKNGKTEE